MKKVLFTIAACILFAIIALYVNHDRDIRVRLVLADQSYMEDVKMVQRRDGVPKWTLNAKRAVFVTEQNIEMSDLAITFPEKKMVLNSEKGMYNTDSKDLLIEGNIKASTGTYDIITTTLLWNGTRNELTSNQKVQIVGKRFVVEGEDLVATTDKARLQKNIRAVFYGNN